MVWSSIHKNSLATSFNENSMGLESDLAKEKKNYTHIVYHSKDILHIYVYRHTRNVIKMIASKSPMRSSLNQWSDVI